MGTTPLIIASEFGHISIVKQLVAAGARTNIAKATMATPLYMACQNGHTEVEKSLLEARASTDTQRCPYSIASKANRTAVFELLEAWSVLTPLMIAVAMRKPEQVRGLLHSGADPRVADCICDPGHLRLSPTAIQNCVV